MAIFKSNPPAEEKTYSKSYRQFKGVDLTSAITEVDDSRSPYAPNMIADMAGFPCKRTGYAKVCDSLGGRINGIHSFITATNIKKMVVHAGDKLYSFDPAAPIVQPSPPTSYIYIAVVPEDAQPQLIYDGMNNARSTSFVYGGKLYILDGENYLVYSGSGNATQVEASAYVPTTRIAMQPAGGGTEYEPVNLLQPKRVNQFAWKDGSAVFQLDTKNIDSVVKCEQMNASGNWQNVTGYTADLAAGRVTFAAAPPVASTGDDNVRITFSKQVAGYADRVKHCTINTFYGIGSDSRIFISGNNNFRNYDWYSWSGHADYFPDINYTVVGAENNAIMGYLKQYDSLMIIKQANDQDASIFKRSATMSGNETVFLTEQGLAGVGAVSRWCFGTLYDDNLFLAKDGVFGLDTSQVTQQRTAQLRSYYVNGELTREPGLEDAVCCVSGGYYYLFVNGHVYIADSKQENQNPSKSHGYEWFYWTDVPARCVIEYEGDIYFGTNEGELHKFKTEADYGMEAYSDNGVAIACAWATKMDTLGDCSSFKRIEKANTGALVMPFASATGDICYVTDGGEEMVKAFSMNTTFDWNDVDFNDMDFGTLPYPTFVPARKKERKVRMFQVIVRNSRLNDAMGLYEIRVEYKMKNPIKR